MPVALEADDADAVTVALAGASLDVCVNDGETDAVTLGLAVVDLLGEGV